MKKLLTVFHHVTRQPLNRKRKLRAVVKFLRWQIGARLLAQKVVIPWVGEARLLVGIGETGLTGNLYGGFMEYEDMLFVLHALRPTETFVDVGANLGAYTILASKIVKSPTIAFEPIPSTVKRLEDQIHLNGIAPMVTIRNVGVGEKEDVLSFTLQSDTTNRVSLSASASNTARIQVKTLDQELDEGTKYFLKIDVEGFEHFVLKGAAKLLATANVVAIIVELNENSNEFGFSREETHQTLCGFGFTPVAYEPASRTLTPLRMFNLRGNNTIYVKDLELMNERCKSSPRRTVHTAYGDQL